MTSNCKGGIGADQDRISRVLALAIAFGASLVFAAETQAASFVYASSTFDGMVYRIDYLGKKEVFASGLGQPHGLAIDDHGNLFVAEVGRDRITKITPNGVQSTYFQFESEYDNPEALAFGQDGTLFVSGTIGSPATGDTNYVYTISADGIAARYAAVGTQENLGIAIGHDGIVYVSDIALGGSIWAVRGYDNSILFASGSFGSWPWGLAIDADGKLNYADALIGAIVRFDDSSDSSQRSVTAELSYPFSLAFDKNGTLFVGYEYGVSIIKDDGSYQSLATGFASARGIAISNVPEPSSLALLSLGLASLGLSRRKKASLSCR